MPNNFKNATNTGIGTNLTSVYTAGTGVTATIIGMTCANTTNSSVNVTVKVTDTSASATASVVNTAPVPSGGSLVVVGGNQKLVLETGDILKAVASDSDSLDVIVSYVEQT